jgi:ubiquinone/menaquinone biosynthesis C-methylase UbiE
MLAEYPQQEDYMSQKPLLDWSTRTYDLVSSFYDFFLGLAFPMAAKAQRRVIQGLKAGTSILDIACGTGSVLEMAAKSGLECYGNDLSSGMLRRARRKIPEATLRQGSFYALPFSNNSFDYVVETNALSGYGVGTKLAMNEMLRVCKPGGQIRIGDYAKAPTETFWTRFTEKGMLLFGDQASDFVSLLKMLGYEPEMEILGWGGMYQYVQITK